MICWDRCGESGQVGVFSRYEVEVLNGYVAGLLNLIERRGRSYDLVTTRSGQEVGVPTELLDDPRIMAVLKGELGRDEPDWVLAAGESQCLREVGSSLRRMASTLPASDAVVHLHSAEDVTAWLRSILCFVASIESSANEEGEINGKKVDSTVNWLVGLSCSLQSAAASSAAGW
ncbi:hypothetical protein AB0E59_42490 [Lentzea sp. NPDC034063]|uniref:hypothetical protein n=1 Tax=unclassified Lentzea TaxID=2643253 RepID=UPI0033FD07CC